MLSEQRERAVSGYNTSTMIHAVRELPSAKHPHHNTANRRATLAAGDINNSVRLAYI